MAKVSSRTSHLIGKILSAPTDNFVELVRTAGLRPGLDFRNKVLRNVDFRDCNLASFDFTGSRFEHCSFRGARLGRAVFHKSRFVKSDRTRADDWDEPLLSDGLLLDGGPLQPEVQSAVERARSGEEAADGELMQLVRRLEADFGAQGWSTTFRSAWHKFGEVEPLLRVADQWLDQAWGVDKALVLAIILSENGGGEAWSERFVNHAVRWLKGNGVEEPGWIRLWIRVMAWHPNEVVIELGLAMLRELASRFENPLYRNRASEKDWVALWRRLSAEIGPWPLLAEAARDASYNFKTGEFAAHVLLPLHRVGDEHWVPEALQEWLFESDPGLAVWPRVLGALLTMRPGDQDLVDLAMHHLDSGEAALRTWHSIWRSLLRYVSSDILFPMGARWIGRSNMRNPGWAEVLSVLIEDWSAAETNALRPMAQAWCTLGLRHPKEALIAAFARSKGFIEEYRIYDLPALEQKRALIIEALEARFGVGLEKVGRNRYASPDDSIRVVCAVSKRYERQGSARYWYGHYDTAAAFLANCERAYFVLGCMDRDEAYAVPASVMRDTLAGLHQTITESASYWHVELRDGKGELILAQPRSGPGFFVRPFAFPLGKPGG